MKSHRVDQAIDCTKQSGFSPVILGRRAMRGLDLGQVLELIAIDEGVLCDVLHWIQEDGHELLQTQQREDGLFSCRIRKPGAWD